MRGGALMAPLLVCSVVAAAVVVERALVLIRDRRQIERRARGFLAPVRAGKMLAARRYLARRGDFLSRMLRHSIFRTPPLDAEEPRAHWSRRLGVLSMVATVAPLIGLLGTVTGMIAAFQGMETVTAMGRSAGPGDLAGGIWAALLTTAAGLFVAIPCYIAHGVLAAAANRQIERLEALHDLCHREYRKHELSSQPQALQAPAIRRRVA